MSWEERIFLHWGTVTVRPQDERFLQLEGTSLGGEDVTVRDVLPLELVRFLNGDPAQVALPRHSPDDREFLISGLSGREFDEIFKEECDDDREG